MGKFYNAIRKDPNYVQALVGLAEAYALLDVYNIEKPQSSIAKAKEAIRKALAVDNQLATAYAVRGFIKATYDWDWPGAKRDLDRAIELDPSGANARHWHALVLCWSGDFDGALEEEKSALTLDPASTVINMTRGVILYYQGEYDQSIEHLSEMLKGDPEFSSLHYYRGRSYQQKEMYDEAIAEYKRDIEVSGSRTTVLATLGNAHAQNGDRAKAHEILAELYRLKKEKYVSPYEFALVNLGLGNKKRCIEYLDLAFREKAFRMTTIGVEPLLDDLREDPKFLSLVSRVGLGT